VEAISSHHRAAFERLYKHPAREHFAVGFGSFHDRTFRRRL
jgi:hypothetical protein